MIGASLDQLESLSGALTTTAGDIGTVDGQAQTAANNAVAEMNTIAEATRSAIESAMGEMIAAVTRSRGELAGADWTGPNRTTFDGHYGTFEGAMTLAQTNTNETFASLKTTIANMGGQIEAYAIEMHNALESASTSTTSMSTAVTTQRNNLESAMGGMSVG